VQRVDLVLAELRAQSQVEHFGADAAGNPAQAKVAETVVDVR
jgi:hypothetical protein